MSLELSREQVEQLLRQHGTIDAAASAGGFGRTAFRNIVREYGLGSRRGGETNLRAIGDPVSREELLEQEVRELRRQVSQTRSAEIVEAKLLELVEQQIGTLRPRYKPAPREKAKGGFTPHRFALQWSDLHAAEVVDPEQINNLNAFDWDVMLRRHEKMRQSVLSFRENRPYPVEGLHLWAIGDMVTGDIHDELRITNEKVIVEAALQLGLDMAEWIEGFVPEFPWIQIDCTFGNHGRLSEKPSFKNAFNNWDWLFYKMLETRFASYPSVTVNAPKSAQVPVMVFDKRVLLWHGDGVRSTMPGVPWGGIIRRTKEIGDTWAKLGLPVDHYVIGHWHEANVVAQKRILMNGSVKGPDEYSVARFGGGAPAAQVLHTFHPRRGLTDTSYLDLSEVR